MRSLLLATCVAMCWTRVVHGDFKKCLGIKMDTLLTVPSCMELFSTCQVGVNKLNQKLHLAASAAYKPVSIISASKFKAEIDKSVKIALLVQVAPLADCLTASVTGNEDSTSCDFDMSKVELYSILLTHEAGASWKLEHYEHHSLSDDKRARIVEEYNRGDFYDSKLAMGIFEAPDLPFQSDLKESASQTPIAVVAASASALLCIGLFVHHRRRLQNGYAPIHFAKEGHVQGKRRSISTEAPEERFLRPAKAMGTEGPSLEYQGNERFAV